MTIRIREKDIERYLHTQVKNNGGLSYKWAAMGQRGIPDRIIIFPINKITFVEVKAPTGSLTDLQRKQHDTLRKMGCQVEVVWSKEDVNDLIVKLTDEIRTA